MYINRASLNPYIFFFFLSFSFSINAMMFLGDFERYRYLSNISKASCLLFTAIKASIAFALLSLKFCHF
jgi:hypothetical protein